MNTISFIFIVKSALLIGNLFLNSGMYCPSENNIMIKKETISSHYLNRKVTFDLYIYKNDPQPGAPYHLLIFNDGQDLKHMGFDTILAQSQQNTSVQNILVAGIYPKERLNEYGTSSVTDYMGRGKVAPAYTQFITSELIPYLRGLYCLNDGIGIAGFSLGGLSAFDIAIHQPSLFNKIGVFSGSFWWRSEAFKPEDPDADRIVVAYLKEYKPTGIIQKFWFQTGEFDEESDRNKNGVIDSIDDTLDVIAKLKQSGISSELITYAEVKGGFHSVETWAAIMPAFLQWWQWK